MNIQEKVTTVTNATLPPDVPQQSRAVAKKSTTKRQNNTTYNSATEMQPSHSIAVRIYICILITYRILSYIKTICKTLLFNF